MDLLAVLFAVVVVLIVVGVLLWIIETAPFIDARMKPIIRWAIFAVIALYIIAVIVGYAPLPVLRR